MSSQRYTNEPFGAFAKCENGDYVLYADHFAELHNLLSTLADIRAALGVGEKPMLGELAGVVRTRIGVIKILEREAKDHAAEVKRLTYNYDQCKSRLDDMSSEVERLTGERDAAVLERDAAVEALRFYAEEQTLDLVQDGGRKARAALDKTGGRNGQDV